MLQKLSDPAFLRSAGMVGHQLLGDGNPAKMTWSFVLYERGGDRNYVRIHADSLNKPFDINSGAKLQLGSTAKLRTLITYLTIVSELHDRLAALPNRDLLRIAASAEDPLTGWAAGYLARTQDRSFAGDARRGDAANLFGCAGYLLYRRRQPELRQFRNLGG